MLDNNVLTWRSTCVIANNAKKQQKLFIQGYNLEVHDVIKYTGKQFTTVSNYITCKPGLVSCNTIRPCCTRCRTPEISHNKGNGSGFTKMLF